MDVLNVGIAKYYLLKYTVEELANHIICNENIKNIM